MTREVCKILEHIEDSIEVVSKDMEKEITPENYGYLSALKDMKQYRG